MNKVFVSAFACGALWLVGGTALAHDDGGFPFDGPEWGAPPPPPEAMCAEARPNPFGADRLKESLGLSDALAAKLDKVFKENAESMKSLIRSRRGFMQELSGQVLRGADDAQIQKTLEGLERADKDLHAAEAKMRETVATLLTPIQRAKLLTSIRPGPGGMAGPWRFPGPWHDRMLRGTPERYGPPLNEEEGE